MYRMDLLSWRIDAWCWCLELCNAGITQAPIGIAHEPRYVAATPDTVDRVHPIILRESMDGAQGSLNPNLAQVGWICLPLKLTLGNFWNLPGSRVR